MFFSSEQLSYFTGDSNFLFIGISIVLQIMRFHFPQIVNLNQDIDFANGLDMIAIVRKTAYPVGAATAFIECYTL
jgi:hypothetical protein